MEFVTATNTIRFNTAEELNSVVKCLTLGISRIRAGNQNYAWFSNPCLFPVDSEVTDNGSLIVHIAEDEGDVITITKGGKKTGCVINIAKVDDAIRMVTALMGLFKSDAKPTSVFIEGTTLNFELCA